MDFLEQPVKGIGRYLLDSDIPGVPLRFHISEVPAGSRSHPPHQHDGYEAFYMLEGEGTFEIEDETYRIAANESIMFDPRKLHGLRNDSNQPMRYMVILYRDEQ